MNNAAQIFNKHARWYQEQFMDVGLYHQSLDAFCAAIPKEHAEVLELACGPGNLTRYVLEKRPDLRILATDLAPDMLDLARKNNPGAAFQLLDCREMRSLGRRFDAILCGFALPYLSKEETAGLLADAAVALTPGGVLYLSAIEGDDSQSGPVTNSAGDTLNMYFYDYAFLEQALRDAGFDVVYAERKEYLDGKGVLVADWMVVGRVGLKRRTCAGHMQFRRRKRQLLGITPFSTGKLIVSTQSERCCIAIRRSQPLCWLPAPVPRDFRR